MPEIHDNPGYWYAHGKLLISGEYLVLHGSKCLAVPLKHGQSLKVNHRPGEAGLTWEAWVPGKMWFSARFNTSGFEITDASDALPASRLQQILQETARMNPSFLKDQANRHAITQLDFPPEWGIGSSSSLVANIGRWGGVNPFELNQRIFGGSGYDIAAAMSDHPIVYQLTNRQPCYESIEFAPPFGDLLWLVYQNKKQNSQEAVKKFLEIKVNPMAVDRISETTTRLSQTSSFEEFSGLMDFHETVLSEILHQQPVKQRLYRDFKGSVKSLGAWGGDFLLAASDQPQAYVRSYFASHGMHTVYPFNELRLGSGNLVD